MLLFSLEETLSAVWVAFQIKPEHKKAVKAFRET